MSIYLRCYPGHYHFNDQHFYETILNHSSFDHVWLFQSPDCNENLGEYELVKGVIQLLVEKYHARRWDAYKSAEDVTKMCWWWIWHVHKRLQSMFLCITVCVLSMNVVIRCRWPSYNGTDTDEINFLLHDLAGLIQSKKVFMYNISFCSFVFIQHVACCMLVLCDYHESWVTSFHFISFLSCLQLILPESSWAYWAGLLSNATEIHVNAPPQHRVMFDMPQYVYHDDMQQMYFGRYNSTVNDIVYDMWSTL